MIASLIRLSAGLPARANVAATSIRPLAFVVPQQHSKSSRRALSFSATARATAAEIISDTAAAAIDAVAPKAARKPRPSADAAVRKANAAERKATAAANKAAADAKKKNAAAEKIRKAAETQKKAAAAEKKKAADAKKKAALLKKKAADKEKALKAKAASAKKPKVPSTLASKPKSLSAYILYLKDVRADIGNDAEFTRTNADGTRGVNIIAFTRKAGEMWKALPQEKKDDYKRKAAENSAQYKRDLEAWIKAMSPAEVEAHNAYVRHRRSKGKTGLARIRDPAKPKIPQSPYLRFLNDNRGRIEAEMGEEANMIAVTKKGASEWKTLDSAEKARYQSAYDAEKGKYDVEFQKWKAQATL